MGEKCYTFHTEVSSAGEFAVARVLVAAGDVRCVLAQEDTVQ